MDFKDYHKNVFINCPFDNKFIDIFYANVFCVFDCGFIPRCALEESDSSEPRIQKIVNLINKCCYGIHDISRTELCSENSLPRFNMPFELGLFIGAKKYGDNNNKKKLCLITDIEKYRYQKFLSDIGGQDIQAHHENPEKAISLLSSWLRTISKRKDIPGGKEINQRYALFNKELPKMLSKQKITKSEMHYIDYCNFISAWLNQSTI